MYEQSTGCNEALDEANDCLAVLNGKISIYSDLEKYLSHLPLKQIVQAIELFIDSRGGIKLKYQGLNSIYRDMENTRKFEPIQKLSANFPNLSKSEETEENPLINILEENNLEIPQNSGFLSGVISEINSFITTFNNAGVLFSKFNTMLDQFQVKPENLSDHIKKYQDQLERIRNPVNFSKEDRLYPLFGHIEKSLEGKSILKIFMPINDLNSYFESKNPVELDSFITPMSIKEEGKISEEVIKSLTDQIQKYIDDFKKMLEIQESLPEISTSLNESISQFESINEDMDKISNYFLNWNSFITENQTLAVNFIKKYLGKTPKSKNFDSLHEILVEFQEKEIEHISTVFETYEGTYDEAETLNENLEGCIELIIEYVKYITGFLEKIDEVKDFILIKNQARYKTMCEKFILNCLIKNKIIPIMATICSRIKNNINVDSIEKKVMDSIIKYSQTFYHYITKEEFLILKKIEVDDKIYLKPYMKKPGGEDQILLDDAPSGSEQAAFSLGIMVALAKIFNAFVVIDEVANRFDHPTEMRFFDAIKQHSEDLFMIIVLWVKVKEDQVEHEFNNIRDSFPNADIFQPIKTGMTSAVKRLQTFEDFMPRGE